MWRLNEVVHPVVPDFLRLKQLDHERLSCGAADPEFDDFPSLDPFPQRKKKPQEKAKAQEKQDPGQSKPESGKPTPPSS